MYKDPAKMIDEILNDGENIDPSEMEDIPATSLAEVKKNPQTNIWVKNSRIAQKLFDYAFKDTELKSVSEFINFEDGSTLPIFLDGGLTTYLFDADRCEIMANIIADNSKEWETNAGDIAYIEVDDISESMIRDRYEYHSLAYINLCKTSPISIKVGSEYKISLNPLLTYDEDGSPMYVSDIYVGEYFIMLQYNYGDSQMLLFKFFMNDIEVIDI